MLWIQPAFYTLEDHVNCSIYINVVFYSVFFPMWRLLGVTLLLLYLTLPVTFALNVTYFGTGRFNKRSLVTGASEKNQWNIHMDCMMLYSEVIQLHETLQAASTLASQMSASDALSTTAAIPCTVALAGQGLTSTLIVVKCSDTSSMNGAKLTNLLSSGDYSTIPDACRATLRVRRDGVVRLRGDDVVEDSIINQPVSGAWNLDRTDQRSLPMNNVYTYARQGTGVTVYIIDTGVRATHEEFGGRASNVANFAEDGIDYDCNGTL